MGGNSWKDGQEERKRKKRTRRNLDRARGKKVECRGAKQKKGKIKGRTERNIEELVNVRGKRLVNGIGKDVSW